MALITYSQAVAHLKQQGVLDVSPEDPDLALKVLHAQAFVLDYVQRPGEWDENSDPGEDYEFGKVQAAILKCLGYLYRFRGEDEQQQPHLTRDLIEPLLYDVKGPVIA